MYLPQIYLQCRQGPTLGSSFPERRVISESPGSPCFSSRLLDRRNDFLLSTVHVLRVTESFRTTERSRNSWIFKSFHSVVKRKHSRSKEPHEWQWTLRRAAFRETGNWTSLPVASERNWGEGVCIVGGQRKELSRSVAGWLQETGWHFRLQKRVFQGCFVVVVFLVSLCSFVLKLSWYIRRLGTYIRHCQEPMMGSWHCLEQNNEMTTGPIMVLDGNKRNSPLVCCWFSLYSGLPLSSQISFNLENVSNQWWAPGWGLLKIQSL